MLSIPTSGSAVQRASTTVLTIVGQDAATHVQGLGRASNVRLLAPRAGDPPLVRAAGALREAAGTSSPFAVTDADPLAAVADAWTRYYDEQGPLGELEVAVAETVARWRAGALELPDYYLVVAADTIAPTRRHWFLGFLHGHAPHRVVPVAPRAEAVTAAVNRLHAGRWWPPCDRLLEGVEHMAPDVFATEESRAEPEARLIGGR